MSSTDHIGVQDHTGRWYIILRRDKKRWETRERNHAIPLWATAVKSFPHVLRIEGQDVLITEGHFYPRWLA
jgi:hypothetical protein